MNEIIKGSIIAAAGLLVTQNDYLGTEMPFLRIVGENCFLLSKACFVENAFLELPKSGSKKFSKRLEA